jgi:hypothetical protein
MIARIKRLVRRNKGMEALQAVILLGAGFLIIWGLMSIWSDDIKPAAQEQLNKTIRGDSTPAASKTSAPKQ